MFSKHTEKNLVDQNDLHSLAKEMNIPSEKFERLPKKDLCKLLSQVISWGGVYDEKALVFFENQERVVSLLKILTKFIDFAKAHEIDTDITTLETIFSNQFKRLHAHKRHLLTSLKEVGMEMEMTKTLPQMLREARNLFYKTPDFLPLKQVIDDLSTLSSEEEH